MKSSQARDQTIPITVLVVYGTRPEIIKLAPVIRALQNRSQEFEVCLCATGQHREMTDQMEKLFDLKSDFDLDLMRPKQDLNDLLVRAVSKLDAVLERTRPDWVLVQGDTTTVLAAALAAFHRGIRLGHIEAGLRTRNLASPFPEEANRSVADLLSHLLFAPTEWARQQLIAEGRPESAIFVTGNTVVDALHQIASMIPEEPDADEVLITIHRRENFGAPLQEIFSAIRELATRFPETTWNYPVHPNPNVSEPAREILANLENVHLLEPVPYIELVRLLRRCRLVLTDSGGIQEEAPTFGKPVLVLRDTTERPEGVEAGAAKLAGTRTQPIVDLASRLLTDDSEYARMAQIRNPYGDGKAAYRIVDLLASRI